MLDDSYDSDDIYAALTGGTLMALACILYYLFFGKLFSIGRQIANTFSGPRGTAFQM